MMNKQEMVFALKKNTENSFTTRKRLMDYTGYIDAKSVDPYIHGLPSVNSRYFIIDVAEQLIEQCRWR